VDEHWVDGAVNGLGLTAGWAGGVLRRLQTGLVQNYLLAASAGALIIFLLLR
jgi:NADH-quinone oxidoreductase subunit L